MIEKGNENLNQGNILLAPRTEAEEERAKDERGEVEGKKMKGGGEKVQGIGKAMVERKGWRQAEGGKENEGLSEEQKREYDKR